MLSNIILAVTVSDFATAHDYLTLTSLKDPCRARLPESGFAVWPVNNKVMKLSLLVQ